MAGGSDIDAPALQTFMSAWTRFGTRFDRVGTVKAALAKSITLLSTL